jgi:hypothetical protein
VKIFAWIAAAIMAFFFLTAFALSSALGGGTMGEVSGSFPIGIDIGLDFEQARNATIAFTVADELHAPPLAVLAMGVAGLGESDFRIVPNGQGSGYCGVFQASPDNIPCNDTEQQARSFLKGGLGFQAGGAIHLAITRSSLSPGTIATMVEGSGQPGRFYDVHRPKVEHLIDAWRSGSTLVDNSAGLLGRMIPEADRMISLHKVYTWGGGHLSFDSDGPWDCSGAISWLMHYLGLLDGRPLTSTEFMTQGEPGRGSEFTIYANDEHVFLIVEVGAHKGDAWGTATRDLEGSQGSGPLFHHHGTDNFVARHYRGH